MSTCPQIISGNAAYSLVSGGWNVFHAFAQSAFNLAASNISNLVEWEAPQTSFSINFAYGGQLESFSTPAFPGYLDGVSGNFDLDVGDLDVQFTPPRVTTVPAFNAGPLPAFDYSGAPDELDVDRPGPAPTVEDVEFPTAPTLTMPTVPELEEITLPTAPTLDIPTFTETAPTVDFMVPTEGTAFTPTEFSDSVLDAVRARVEAMLEGEAMPEAVEQALRNRAYSELDRNDRIAVQQVTEDIASRGFSEPTGVMAGRILEIRQNSQNQRNALSRDIYIKSHDESVQNLRFAVTQGIALTQVLIGLHMEMARLGLESAKFVLEASINIFNARVNLFNARVQAYNVQAVVYRERLQALLATVELYKAQIEAERVRGEINEQRTRLYEQQLRALLTEVEIFKSQVDAAKAQVEAGTAVFEGYRSEVQAYAEYVRAHSLEWDGFRAKIDAQIGRARVYEVGVNAYAARVNAVNTANQVAIAESNARTQIELGKIEKFRAVVAAQAERVRAESAAVQANVAVGEANARMYAAQGEIARAASEAGARMYAAAAEAARAEAEVNIKNAELNITSVNQTAALYLEAKKGAAQASTQLAASSMSAVNFSAGVSSSQNDSNSSSCSTSYNYSGEIAT